MRFAKRSVWGCSLLFSSVIPLVAQTLPHAQVGSPTATAQATPEKSRPTTYGTSALSYIEVPATEFLPWDSTCAYTSDSDGWGPRWSPNACPFNAGLHLPSGAKPIYLELDFVDTNPFSVVVGSLVECDYLGQNCTTHPAAGAGPSDCVSSGYICSGSGFSGGTGFQTADLTPDGITVDNFIRSYRLTAEAQASGGSLKIAGMIVGYILQVSLDPVTATFNDVPVGHPQHRFVEALVAAGITAGCNVSPPLYCPDSPLTRGQMAVYLSVALGLQFP